MRNEDDLRAALASLECRAPDAEPVLAAVRIRTAARRLVMRRHLHRSLAAGGSLAAAAVAVAVVMSTAAGLPGGPKGGPPGSHGPVTAATVLRQLANMAAEQPTPVLGPVLYVKAEGWGLDIGPNHYGLNYRSHEFGISESWYGPGREINRAKSHGKVYFRDKKISLSIYRKWWLNPAKLPVRLAALRRHLLGYSADGRRVVKYQPGPAGITILSNALQVMQTGPLRPALRASLLRLIADVAQNPPKNFLFFVLGNLTDRAGHRGVAIAEQTASDTAGTSLIIDIFAPVTGALIAQEYTWCYGPAVRDVRAADLRCTPRSYGQILVIKGMASFPRRWGKGGTR